MKPDFNTMSRTELLAYLKEHRTDDEAWGIYLDRRSPGAKQYPPPLDDEGIKILETAIRQKVEEIENKQDRPRQV